MGSKDTSSAPEAQKKSGTVPVGPGPKEMSNVVQGTAETFLTKLEKAVAEGSTEYDEDEEILQDSQPGPLLDESKDVEEVLNIISQSICREGQGQQLLQLCDKSSLLSVVSHSLSAYITTLDPVPLQKLSARIAAEVSIWVCDLFNFKNGSAYCHDDTREGLVKVTRMALHKLYPKMATDGFETLFARPPVIYLTSATYAEVANHVCVQLGLPLSTVRVLQANTKEKMEETIKEDRAAGKLPVLCVANVHSSSFQALNAAAFEKLCRDNDIWLHLEGHALAGLALLKNDKRVLPQGNSLSLTIGSWLGIPSLPYVTVFKSAGSEAYAQSAGLSTVVPSVRLNCLPLWCVLRSLGTKQFKLRIGNIFELMEILNTKLAEIPSLRILSQRPEAGVGFVTVEQLLKGNFKNGELYKTVSPALAFQYVSPNPPDQEPGQDGTFKVPDYFNNLNSWLGQTMQRDCPQIPLEIVDVETTGYVLRLCPFESLAFSGMTLTEDDLALFVDGLENQASILDATVKQREKFIQLIGSELKLEHVEISHWAGLGGVRYISPEFLPKDETVKEVDTSAFTADQSTAINQRNLELLRRLRTLDSAFSLGEAGDKMCIRFGMVSEETDVEELLNLVVTSGQELDEQLVELNQMGDLVRKGIEQAADDLRKESDEAIWQEGVLRHVPLVGSLYNWLSPIQKPQIKGRFLSLNEGKLQSTESIYQHAKGIADEHVLTKENSHETQEEVVEESAEKEQETAQETDKDLEGKVDGVEA